MSLIVLFISIILFKFSIGSFSLKRLSMVGYLFYFHIIVLTYIGVVAVVTHLDTKFGVYFFAITGTVSDESRLLGWYTVMYAVVVLPIGMIMANILFIGKINASPFTREYQMKKIRPIFNIDQDEKILFLTLLFFTIIATLAVVYVFFTIHSFPLFKMLSGETGLELRQLRGTVKLGFHGIVAIRDMIALPLPPLLSYIAYITYRKTKLYHYKFLFYYLVLLSILILTYDLEKAPVVLYGFSFIILRGFIGKTTVSFFKLLFYVFIILILLMMVFASMLGGDSSIALLISQVMARIFVAQSSVIFLAQQYFPLQHGFIGWSGVSRLFAGILGEPTVSSGRIMFEIFSPQSIANGTAGYIVGFFTAEAWALFGIWGVILSPLWVGFFIQSIHLLIMKSAKTPIALATYIYVMMHWQLTGGFVSFIYPIVLFKFFIQIFIIYYISYMIKVILLNTKKKEVQV